MKARKRFAPPAVLWSAFAFLLMLAFLLYGGKSALTAHRGEVLRAMENSVRRAAAACYALEGSYPPDYAYIAKNYGVRVDEGRYAVLYRAFASNVMPEITVLPLP